MGQQVSEKASMMVLHQIMVARADEGFIQKPAGISTAYSIVSATGAWATLGGDINGDDDVDFVDLAILAEHIEGSSGPAPAK